MAKIRSFVGFTGAATQTGGGTNYPVKTAAGDHYVIYIDQLSDVVFRKSTDGGKTWSAATVVHAGTATQLAVWYDRWSNISAGLIHLAYTGSASDTLYRTIDTESGDTLSTETTIFNGASTASGGALSITRARGGNVYCKTMIDAGAEGGFFRLLNANVPNGAWASRTDSEALATTDQWILVPGFAADNQDIICIFWDASADELDRVLYDDSGDSWALTNISTGMVDVATNVTFPHFSAAVDLTNSQILVVAWNGVDTANQDLLGWRVTEGAITAFGTTPVLNATDDCGLCAVGIDTDTQDWHVFYGGPSGGSGVWNITVNLYTKVSTDDGATWGSETLVTPGNQGAGQLNWLTCSPRFDTRSNVFFFGGGSVGLVMVDEPASAAGLASNMFGGGVVQ